MKKSGIFWPVLLALFFLVSFMAAGTSVSSWSQQGATPGTVPVSIIVSVEAKHGKEVPAVYKQDVMVMHDKDRLQVTAWDPCQSAQAGVELFVIVDDATSTDIGLQFDDLKKFMQAQPPTTLIGVAYARNGAAMVAQNLTQDHAQAAKALRLPQGFGATASPYLSVTDLAKKWPPSARCRQIMMVSSGIDYLQSGPQNTYLAQAIDQAQRAAIQVYAIYAQPVGHAGHDFFRLNWGQNNLAQLTDETGGEFYIQGVTAPIAFAPYLTEYAEKLTHQFRLTFLAQPAAKAGFQRIKLETEVTNAELEAQDKVWVPVAK
jgi:hypothetical protein